MVKALHIVPAGVVALIATGALAAPTTLSAQQMPVQVAQAQNGNGAATPGAAAQARSVAPPPLAKTDESDNSDENDLFDPNRITRGPGRAEFCARSRPRELVPSGFLRGSRRAAAKRLAQRPTASAPRCRSNLTSGKRRPFGSLIYGKPLRLARPLSAFRSAPNPPARRP